MTRDGSKLVSIDEAVAVIPEDALIAIGGAPHRNRPMALLRALIRSGMAPREVWLPGHDTCTDLLRALWPACTVEDLDPAARRASSAAGRRTLGLAAAAFAAASLTVPGDTEGGRRPTDVRVDAIAPDVALFHVPFADQHGNAVWAGDDRWLAELFSRASRLVIVVADELVTAGMSTHDSVDTLSAALVDHVVRVPFGAHPMGCARLYGPDDAALADLRGALTRPERLGAWCERHIYGPTDHIEYLEGATNATRLAEISGPAGLSWPVRQ